MSSIEVQKVESGLLTISDGENKAPQRLVTVTLLIDYECEQNLTSDVDRSRTQNRKVGAKIIDAIDEHLKNKNN